MAVEGATAATFADIELCPSTDTVAAHTPSIPVRGKIDDARSTRAALLTAPILPTLLKLALPTVTVLMAQTWLERWKP